MKAIYFFTFLLLFSVSVVSAQTAPVTGKAASAQTDPKINTLQQQFNQLKYRSSTHSEFNQDYKVVKLRNLDAFWKNVADTLRARDIKVKQARKGIEQELVQAKKNLQEQDNQLQRLKQENAQKELEVQKSVHNVANISFLGLDMNKTTFVILSWGTIIILLVGLGILFYLFKNSKYVTDEKIKSYNDIEQEFKTHKQTSREKELKIKRELQTEMNRVEELKQEIAVLKKQAQH
ncbi:MAG: hypothetical protein JWQ14_479 [Adhaeribacter sp.]|nr:hypothetical protein [Adhaeribacter sp.]